MWGKREDMVVHGTDPYNAEPAPSALAARHLTALDTFYSRNHGAVPEIDKSTWRMRIDGLVRTPLVLGLEDLTRRFEQRTVVATLQCAGNRRADLHLVRDIPGEDLWGPWSRRTRGRRSTGCAGGRHRRAPQTRGRWRTGCQR